MNEYESPGFYLADCMDGMKQFPDGFFDLAIVDPPYGGGANSKAMDGKFGNKGSRFERYRQQMSVERTGGTWATKYGTHISDWDIAPSREYFEELFRVSKNQIIWGANYFELPPTRCFVVWRKKTISENFTMAMAEYAWTSFNSNAKVFEAMPQGTKNDPRIHPTQKPVKLYEWLLDKYAKDGDKILDTHVGSASSLIACRNKGFAYWGFEIDPLYYEKAKERMEKDAGSTDSAPGQTSLMDILEGL